MDRVCRRQILDRYFDNDSGRITCKSTEAACDICYERLHSVPDAFSIRSSTNDSGTLTVATSPPSTPTTLGHFSSAMATSVSAGDLSVSSKTIPSVQVPSSSGYIASAHKDRAGMFASSLYSPPCYAASTLPRANKRPHSASSKQREHYCENQANKPKPMPTP